MAEKGQDVKVRPRRLVTRSDDFLIFGDVGACEPGFEHGVDGFGSFLLNPVGDAGQDAEGEVGDVVFGALGGAKVEGDVGVAPEE